MDFAKIDARLLSYPGASKAFHEKWGWMVYWVGDKQFACELMAKPDAKQPYAGRHLLSLKCDPDRILELRAEYPDAVLPGYYFLHLRFLYFFNIEIPTYLRKNRSNKIRILCKEACKSLMIRA